MTGAWSNWSQGTIDGHAPELAILQEHVPDATMAEAAVSGGRACVVAWADRLVVVTAGRPVRYGTGAVEVRVDGPSASIRQGAASAVYVPVPFALAVRVLAADGPTSSSETPR